MLKIKPLKEVQKQLAWLKGMAETQAIKSSFTWGREEIRRAEKIGHKACLGWF